MNPVVLADNRFLDGTPTATDTAAEYSALNIRDLRTFTFWKAANNTGDKYLSVDCGTAKAVDSIGIAGGHNLGTVGAYISVESSSNGSSWSEVLAPFQATSDRSLLVRFSAASARYWRVKLAGSNAAPKVGVLLLGSAIEFPCPPEAPFAPGVEEMESETNRSKAGHLLGTIVRFKTVRVMAEFRVVSRTWVETYFLPFWRGYASNLAPFLWAWDLSAYPEDVIFGKVPDGSALETPVSVLEYYDAVRLEVEGVKED